MEIKILTSNSTLPVLDALIPVYEKSSGNTVTVSADSAKAMVARIRGGESGDVLVLGNGAVKELTEAGFINGAEIDIDGGAHLCQVVLGSQREVLGRRAAPTANLG